MKKLLIKTGAFALLFTSTLFFMSLAGDEKDIKIITPYLGHSNLNGGLVSKMVFDSLIKQGITARDSSGISYPVAEFTFGYGERNIYEDANGKLVVMTDYLSEYCAGDTLSIPFKNFIFRDNRTKHGDTVYVDKIKVRMPNGRTLGAKSMRFVLTK